MSAEKNLGLWRRIEMKIKAISALAIFILLITAISCKRNVSPFVPEIDTAEQAGKAKLVGNIVLTGSDIKDFSSINIGVRGTNLRVNPDERGDFRIDNLHSGDILLEVDIRSSLSYISINDVKSNDEIDVKMEVLANDKVILKEKTKKDKSKKALYVTVKPYKWNTDWEDSSDEVTARIYGKGFDDIVGESVQMVGPEGDMIESFSFDSGGNSFVVKFLQKDAIAIILDPKPGESHEIQVTGEFSDGTSFELTDTVIIAGKKSEGDLFLEIEPHKWNTSWVNSEGVVTAKITGEGFDRINPDTVKMIGPEGDEIPFQSYEIAGNCFMAKFLKKDALSIIPEPVSGDIHEIQVIGALSDGESFELTEVIIIAGKKSEGELSLVINPGKWNTDWEESSDEVTAKITGEGFDEIDPGSVKMIGPEGDEIAPFSYEAGEDSFIAEFYRKDALSLIPDPKPKDSYVIQVTGTFDDGIGFTLKYTISIVGSKK
jgi:hypothetical protein